MNLYTSVLKNVNTCVNTLVFYLRLNFDFRDLGWDYYLVVPDLGNNCTVVGSSILGCLAASVPGGLV